jgi:protein-tyrosine kinase
MERIREAVEQASRERKRSGGQGAPVKRKQVPVQVPVSDASFSETDFSETDSIEYTETKLVKVSPELRKKNNLVAAIPGHPLQDSYRMLRTRVMQDMRANNWNTVAVISPNLGAGKTMTAINLAISIGGSMSHTAMLFDADFRRPSVGEYFGYKPEFGITDFFFKGVPLDKVMFHPDIDRLTVLTEREATSDSAEVLSSPKLGALFQEMRQRYADRIIVVDSAPVLEVDDVLALIPNVDCMLVVVENGVTTKDDLQKTLELLEAVPILGTVLNKSTAKIPAGY